jgi:hypothetical protein
MSVMVSKLLVLPIDPVSASPVSALLLLSCSGISVLSSGGSHENAAISSLGASLGVGSSWCSESS